MLPAFWNIVLKPKSHIVQKYHKNQTKRVFLKKIWFSLVCHMFHIVFHIWYRLYFIWRTFTCSYTELPDAKFKKFKPW